MVSIEQIAVLEQKVESAVAKIAQLTAENDALRSKCVELTNALSEKTEQLSAFHADQNKIEVGIMKALEQLKSLEGSLLPKETSEQVSQEETVSENESAENKSESPATEGNQGESDFAENSTEAENQAQPQENAEYQDSESQTSENYENQDEQNQGSESENTEDTPQTEPTKIFDIF